MARHYDLLMDLLMVGRYQSFIERAIERIDIRRGDAILDLGSWTTMSSTWIGNGSPFVGASAALNASWLANFCPWIWRGCWHAMGSAASCAICFCWATCGCWGRRSWREEVTAEQ